MGKLARKVRFAYHYVIAFSLRHGRIIVTGFIAGFFFFFLVFHITPILKQALYPETKRVGLVGSYTPETLPITVQKLISRGLTEIAEDGQAHPDLADSWDIDDSGKLYTFHLKKNITWHDGKVFTARDINYNIRDVKFTVVDDNTIKIQLKEPFRPLPVLLSRPLMREGLSGLGIYKVSAIKFKGDKIESLHLIPANSNQPSEDNQEEQLPILKLKFYLTEEQARLAFKLGEVDILEDLSSPGEFSQWPNVEIKERVDHTRYVALFYNLKDNFLSDKTVRQALSFAVPNFEFERATGPISPLSWAYNSKVKQYKFDLDAAKRLLKEETKEATQSSKITISTFLPYLNLARRIADSWQNLGFTVDIRVEDSLPQKFQVLLAAQEIPPDPDQYPLWHSTQTDTNITGLANPKIDKLLEDGRKNNDPEEILKIYHDFQRYLVDEAPATFLYFPNVYTVKRK